MTVSMRVMSAGTGYQYLLRSVAAGDGNRLLSTRLTRYYTETGTPPGRWLGSGLHALGHGEIRRELLLPPTDADVVVQTLFSGISRGTEALVFGGHVPQSEWTRMRAPFQEGEFPGPVKYGYANVGRVECGPAEITGRPVFVLYPHQTRYVVPASAVSRFAGVQKVWIVFDGVAKQQPVRTGREKDGRVEILDGIEAGSTLVLRADEGHDGPVIATAASQDGLLRAAERPDRSSAAGNVENAKLFQNFVMDPENAAMISAYARYANGIAGSEAFMPEDMRNAPELTLPEGHKGVFIQACPPEVNEMMTRIWTDLQK